LRGIWSGLVVIFLAACVAEQPVEAVSKEDKSAVNRQYLICERSAIAGLDDGISDARTIASAVFSACSSEAYASARVYAAALPLDAQSQFLAEVPETYRQVALEGVLRARAANRN